MHCAISVDLLGALWEFFLGIHEFEMQTFVTLKLCCGVSAARQRIHQLKADIDRLGKSVNSSAGMLLEKTEAELQTLLNRKSQVEGDRVRTYAFK